MELVAIVTLIAIVEFIVFGMKVGTSREKYGVNAPATTGHDMFERHYRVHYNTLEQLIIFLPGLWLFGFYIGYSWAAGIGLIYLVGRVIYGIAYIKDPGSRGIGMLLSVLPCWVLILGGLVGATWSLIVG
jgi:glutathione S-transferase